MSFGAGVQSVTLALLSQNRHPKIPVFDCAIFADTGAEPQSVYDSVDAVSSNVNFPVIITKHKEGLLNSIKDAARNKDKRFAGVPFFTQNPDGAVGMLKRQCTNEYKIQPVKKAIREFLGYKKGQRVKHNVNLWIGISRDEMTRMTISRDAWIQHKYPLVEMEWRRSKCISYLKQKWNHPFGKSSCTFCPYHDAQAWRELKNKDTESWQQIVEVDRQVRNGFKGADERLYLHKSCKPIDEVDFDAILARHDDQNEFGFLEECEGMCGL